MELYSSEHSLKLVAEATFWSVTLGVDAHFAKMSYAEIRNFQPLDKHLSEKTECLCLINNVWAKLAQLSIPEDEINFSIAQAAWCVYVHHNSVEKMQEEEKEYECCQLTRSL